MPGIEVSSSWVQYAKKINSDDNGRPQLYGSSNAEPTDT